MKSMTGYGRGECSQHGFKVTVEVSSVNRKQTEILINLPPELDGLESRLRDEIHHRISRGRLLVRVSVHSAPGRSANVRLDLPLAKAYARQLGQLAKALKLEKAITLDLLLRAPGVVQAGTEDADAELFWPAVEKALQAALKTLIRMRTREGGHLAKDLAGRMAFIQGAVERIQQQAPQVVKRYQLQLLERIKGAGLEVAGMEDERLLKEVVFFADRSDISEELTRLQSHFQQFQDCLRSPEPVGRILDFLSQEMNREINTVGSKANDSLISREVVAIKAELEKFREQVQNVE